MGLADVLPARHECDGAEDGNNRKPEGWCETCQLASLRPVKPSVKNLNYSTPHGEAESFMKILVSS